MLEQLTTLRNIIANIEWIMTLGASDLKSVRDDTDQLIHDLSASYRFHTFRSETQRTSER